MATSFDQFCALDFEQQIAMVVDQGSYIATRCEEENTVGLYYMR